MHPLQLRLLLLAWVPQQGTPAPLCCHPAPPLHLLVVQPQGQGAWLLLLLLGAWLLPSLPA
jgi:hypothetical protein